MATAVGEPAHPDRGGVIVYSAGPTWLRVIIAIGAAALFLVMAWRFVRHR